MTDDPLLATLVKIAPALLPRQNDKTPLPPNRDPHDCINVSTSSRPLTSDTHLTQYETRLTPPDVYDYLQAYL